MQAARECHLFLSRRLPPPSVLSEAPINGKSARRLCQGWSLFDFEFKVVTPVNRRLIFFFGGSKMKQTLNIGKINKTLSHAGRGPRAEGTSEGRV